MMRSIEWWTCLYLITPLLVTQLVCGDDYETTTSSEKIGNNSEGEFASAAAVLVLGEFMCSGSVIAPDAVITAAICLALIPGLEAHEISVVVGSEDRNEGFVVNASSFFAHPNFRYYPQQMVLEHDIAVIKLSENLELQSRELGGLVEVINLVDDNNLEDKWANQDGVVAGWGVAGSRDTQLQIVNVTVAHQVYCADFYANLTPAPYHLTGAQLCSLPASGLCIEKSGAGLRVRGSSGDWVLVGITGPSMCSLSSQRPEIFTRVSRYKEWIGQVLHSSL